MSKSLNFKGKLSTADNKIEIRVQVDLIEFEEDNLQYIFCPALDLYGYGNSSPEAIKSFEVVLAEYFRYTINKKTVKKDLERIGWKITKSGKYPKYRTPDLSSLLIDNEDYQDILNNHDYKKTTKEVLIPTYA